MLSLQPRHKNGRAGVNRRGRKMQKMQKTGFLVSASLFIVTGIIFLITGTVTGNGVLKTMGKVWLPMGIVHLLLISYFTWKSE